jgi:hypothetical protein
VEGVWGNREVSPATSRNSSDALAAFAAPEDVDLVGDRAILARAVVHAVALPILGENLVGAGAADDHIGAGASLDLVRA